MKSFCFRKNKKFSFLGFVAVFFFFSFCPSIIAWELSFDYFRSTLSTPPATESISFSLLQNEKEPKGDFSSLDFQEKEIVARYEEEKDHTNVELRYKVIGKQQDTIFLTLGIPIYLYDSGVKNKRALNNRIALLKTETREEKELLELRRVVHYPWGGNAKDWTFLADLGYGMVEGSLENEITLWNRSELGEGEKTRISSSRLIHDLTSLLYLGSWLNQKGLQEFKLRYFNDRRVLPATLVRRKKQRIRIKEKEIEVVSYVLIKEGKGEEELFRLFVGSRDHFLYQWEILPTQKKLTLTGIEH